MRARPAGSDMKRRSGVLFVTYNGLLEPIGQSQILPYLRGLARQGIVLGILSFEKVEADRGFFQQRSLLHQELRRSGVRWLALRYHRSRSWLVKLYDVIAGVLAVCVLTIIWRVQVIHARSAVAGMMALPALALLHRRLLFDIRGLNAEEYVDGSGWSRQGLRYRFLKAVEGHLIRRAQAVVVLTERVRTLLQRGQYVPRINGAPIQVIPCCVDLTLFRYWADARATLRECPSGWPIFIYSGQLGTWYLLEEMLACFRLGCDRWPSAHLLILTLSPSTIVEDAINRAGISRPRVTIRRVPYPEVPLHLSLGDIGLCFIKPSLSKLSSSPTKIAEYLACGIPILANAGVGDVAELVTRYKVGAAVHEFSDHGYQRALDHVEKLLADRERARQQCRAAAEQEFSLAWAIDQYRNLYDRILSGI